MLKKIAILIICIFILTSTITNIYAGGILYHENKTEIGKVVGIIDGEVVKVFFYRRKENTPSVEIVKIIGINTEGSVEGFEYTSKRLLGKSVYVSYDDDLVTYAHDGMIQANIFVSFDQTFAEELLEQGLAVVDTKYQGTQHYIDFLKAEYSAKLYEEGRWATELSRTTDRININTVGKIQLMDVLSIDSILAEKIIHYRYMNKFDDITEIMAVDKYFNEEWFESNRHLISVITNVNRLSYTELSSLMPPSANRENVIKDILNYTRFHSVNNLIDLKTISSFKPYYANVEAFLTVRANNIYTDINIKRVNINTSSMDRFLLATKLSVYSWQKLKGIREEEPLISSIGELIASNILSSSLRYMYTPYMVVYTDINTANTFELMSLLDNSYNTELAQKAMVEAIINGRPYKTRMQLKTIVGSEIYSKIYQYIYVYENEIQKSYNINTVPKIYKDSMIEKYNGNTTRFSNINMLDKDSLLDLHPDMSLLLVDDILLYRIKHDFRYKDDLKSLFIKHNRLALYNKITQYLTVE